VDFAQPVQVAAQYLSRVGRYPGFPYGLPSEQVAYARKQLARIGRTEVHEYVPPDRAFLMRVSPRVPDTTVGQDPYPCGIVARILGRKRFMFERDLAPQVPFQLLFGRLAALSGLRLVRTVGETGGLGLDEQSPPGEIEIRRSGVGPVGEKALDAERVEETDDVLPDVVLRTAARASDQVPRRRQPLRGWLCHTAKPY